MNQEDVSPPTPTGPPGSMVMVEVNGQQYPMKRLPTCYTCMSPYRRDIELALIEGQSYRSIAKDIADYEVQPRQPWPHPTPASIRHHVQQNHMPLGPTAERALIEERAREIGRDLENYGSSLVDHVSANKLVIQRGMTSLARGDLKPTMGDLLTAIRTQQTIEQAAEDGVDSAAWQEALVAYMEVAQQFIPHDAIQAYGQALAKHPILRAMMSGVQPAAIEGEVVSNG